MNKTSLFVFMCIVVSIGGDVRAEDAPKPKHIPRKYSEQIDLHSVTFDQKTPDDLKKEENSSDDPFFGSDDSQLRSSIMTPSVFVMPQPPPRSNTKKKDDHFLSGDSTEKDEGKASGWGWLADDIAKSKSEKTAEEASAELDENPEEDMYSISTMDRISGWEKSDQGWSQNPASGSTKEVINGSQGSDKPVIEEAALDRMADRFGKKEDNLKTIDQEANAAQSFDQRNDMNINAQVVDLPITKALLSKSPIDNSMSKQFESRAPGEITANNLSYGSSRKETSMFSPMPLSATSIDNDGYYRKSSSSFEAGSSWGNSFEAPKNSSFSSPYASSTPAPSSSKPLGESLFSSSPTPTPSTWSTESSKGNQGIRTQTLPW